MIEDRLEQLAVGTGDDMLLARLGIAAAIFAVGLILAIALLGPPLFVLAPDEPIYVADPAAAQTLANDAADEQVFQAHAQAWTQPTTVDARLSSFQAAEQPR